MRDERDSRRGNRNGDLDGVEFRAEEDYATLLGAARFRVRRVLPTATGLQMIKATVR